MARNLRAERAHGLAINLAIGPSCFVSCQGCYNLFGQTDRRGGLVSADDVLTFAETARDLGVGQVTVSGGDPLTHPQILTILQGLRDLGLFIKLDTVGTALLRDSEKVFYGSGRVAQLDAASLAPLVDMIGFPLDGSDARTQARFRKARKRPSNATDEPFPIEGLQITPREDHELNRTDRGYSSAEVAVDTPRLVRMMKSLGVSVCVNTVVHAQNASDIPALAAAIAALQPDLWQLFEFQSAGVLAVRNADKFNLAASRRPALTPIREREDALIPLPQHSFDAVVAQARAVAPHVTIQPKSARARSKIYFMVNDAGIAWIPSQNDSPKRIGHITHDRDAVLDSLRSHLRIDAV